MTCYQKTINLKILDVHTKLAATALQETCVTMEEYDLLISLHFVWCKMDSSLDSLDMAENISHI